MTRDQLTTFKSMIDDAEAKATTPADYRVAALFRQLLVMMEPAPRKDAPAANKRGRK